tara:strand:+ start:1830 stop:2177 length:348 start_codon:yes stop_codon:yes gene_type:complete
MGTTRTKGYDRNRFKKVYPRFRTLPKPGLMTDGDVILEAVHVNFSNSDSMVVRLDGHYPAVPSVSVTPVGDINNVNVFISSILKDSVPSGQGNILVTIESSAAFTGIVHLQAVSS